MLKVTLSYAMDGANIADIIYTKLVDFDSSWDIERYPALGNNENTEFWLSIRNGRLKADIILFVGTESFIENNSNELKRLNKLPEYAHYRFAWILIGRNSNLSSARIPCDIDLRIGNIKPDEIANEDEINYITSQIFDYFKVVEIVVSKNRKLKEERKKRNQRMLNIMIPVMIAYVGIIFSAAYVLSFGNTFQYKSSAEFLLLLTAVMGICAVSMAMALYFRNRQKREEKKEKEEFDKELDVSLSNYPDKITNKELIFSTLKAAVDSQPIIDNKMLDSLFAILRLNSRKTDSNLENAIQGEPTKSINQSQLYDSDDNEIAQALGENNYLPLGHLKFNWKQMKGYYDISKRQAQVSFTWAIIICFLGIAIIIFAVLSPLIPAFATKNSLIPVIGSIGGAVVELFAGTILAVYIKSLSQMNIYHKALSEYQRYLSCVNLVSKLSSQEKQDDLFMEIIRGEIRKSEVLDDDDIKYLKKIIEQPKISLKEKPSE